MSNLLQLVVPFAVALVVLGIFHIVAYLHLQLVDDAREDDGLPEL